MSASEIGTRTQASSTTVTGVSGRRRAGRSPPGCYEGGLVVLDPGLVKSRLGGIVGHPLQCGPTLGAPSLPVGQQVGERDTAVAAGLAEGDLALLNEDLSSGTRSGTSSIPTSWEPFPASSSPTPPLRTGSPSHGRAGFPLLRPR
ncbi:hypothetical protein ACG83_30060 [Frankia sp. R43]|nr:hypothetical protein ACG83_30060 [Frankia sp. R43]